MPYPCHFKHLNCTMSETDLIPFSKALKSAKKNAQKKWKERGEKDMKNSLSAINQNISKMSLAFFCFSLQLYDRFFDNFSDFKCLDNVISLSFISFYFFTFFSVPRQENDFLLVSLMSSFECSCYVRETDDTFF